MSFMAFLASFNLHFQNRSRSCSSEGNARTMIHSHSEVQKPSAEALYFRFWESQGTAT